MKIWKIIFAILSILLGAFLFYESSQVEHSGQFVQRLGVEIDAFTLYVGFIVSIIYIVIGICTVIKYEKNNKRMNLILLVLAIAAFILSFMGPKIFEDLYFCSFWAIVCIVTLVISIVKKDRNDKKNNITKNTITLLTTCPYCNAQIENGSKFCGECGKELPQGNVCAHCGATVNEGDSFCEECGRNLKDGSYASADYGEKSGMDYMKILLSSLVGIVIGLVILAVVGGSWYGYNAYSEYSAAKAAREKFVADSLEKVKQDSIKLAEMKEKEKIQAEKDRIDDEDYLKFREKFTFKNVLDLLKNPNNASLAQKCGLSLIFKDTRLKSGDTDTMIIYGYGVEKGEKRDDIGYLINFVSKHACYLTWREGDELSLLFKNGEELNSFLSEAEKYGLYKMDEKLYIPSNKISSGVQSVEELDLETDVLMSFTVNSGDGGMIFFYPVNE